MDAERTGKRGPHQADTPPRVGNYVTARVGNYVTDNPSNLGKYVTADTHSTPPESRSPDPPLPHPTVSLTAQTPVDPRIDMYGMWVREVYGEDVD